MRHCLIPARKDEVLPYRTGIILKGACYVLPDNFYVNLAEVSELSSRLTSESRIYADKAKDLNRQVSMQSDMFASFVSYLFAHVDTFEIFASFSCVPHV
ncbi:hypothetical protein BHE74_00016266 [Ensete ventricosum]|nr:hypothetical protein BHE74_00016266 [Ensete ventricosum]